MEMRRYRKILHISYTDQRGSPCQDPAGNWTTIRPPDHWWHCKETQTVVVWSCLPLIRSGQNNPARHSERGKKTRQTRGRGGKTTSGNGQAWSSKVPEGSGEQGKIEKTGCKIIYGAPTTLAVKGLMMMMMMLVNQWPPQKSPKEEYKPWKWGATAGYHATHTQTMLPTRKSVLRSCRQLDCCSSSDFVQSLYIVLQSSFLLPFSCTS